jgi:hypothetical protein
MVQLAPLTMLELASPEEAIELFICGIIGLVIAYLIATKRTSRVDVRLRRFDVFTSHEDGDAISFPHLSIEFRARHALN